MKVSELGEFGLIDLLAKLVNISLEKQASQQQVIIGIGDDAGAWRGDTSTQLVTTDSLTQDVHFSLNIISWKELGWKALSVNLSDIAAMGGVPRYALISLALPGTTQVEDVTDLYQGMIELAQQFKVAMIGGDTSRAPLVSITITVLGSARNGDKHILSRFAAKPGDKIAVTGYLGAAAAGLEMLTNQLQFDPEATTYLRDAFLRPLPRIAEGQLLVKQGVKTAIDISDGLFSDLKQVCKASQVSARVEIEGVPIHSAVKANFGDRALELALSGGEDYELLFTARAEVINRVKEAASRPITVIGEITAGKAGEVNLVDINGNPFHLHKEGWEHFR
ncbi:MAG: thiamine-phosphate kinase [Dehalococcoidales bacterium]